MKNRQEILKQLIIEKKHQLQGTEPIQDVFGYRLYVILSWIGRGFALLVVHIAAITNSQVLINDIPGNYRTQTDSGEYIGWFLLSSAIAYAVLYMIDKAVKYLFFYQHFYSSKSSL